MSYKKQELLTLHEHLRSPQFFGRILATHIFSFVLYCSIMCLYVLSSVLWCPLRFPHINVVRFLLSNQLFVGDFISYLCYMCLFADSGVHHILCSVFCFACPRFLYLMKQVSLDCPFCLFLRFSLSFINTNTDHTEEVKTLVWQACVRLMFKLPFHY